MGRGPEVLGMFGGYDASKGAQRVVRDARDLGIDPAPYITRAVEHHTETGGRRRIIVKPGSPLGTLKDTVMSRKATGR